MIRAMEQKDRAQVIDMMRTFYASPAVLSNGSDEIFSADVDNCIGACPFIEGYVFEGKDGLQGYAMLAKSFSAEFGQPCIWVEDLYVAEPYRGLGIGSRFLKFAEEKYPGHIFRLEAEEENQRAVHVYKKRGFQVLPYLEMIKHPSAT